MEKNETFFRPERLMEWLMYASLYQLRKSMRYYRNFTRKMSRILKKGIKERKEIFDKYGVKRKNTLS